MNKQKNPYCQQVPTLRHTKGSPRVTWNIKWALVLSLVAPSWTPWTEPALAEDLCLSTITQVGPDYQTISKYNRETELFVLSIGIRWAWFGLNEAILNNV